MTGTIDGDAKSASVGNRWTTSRIEAFSDGVLAIAITLLVLDIRVPASEFDDLWQGIADEWPAYFGFATSFFTIGAYWLLHHGVFRRIRYADVNVIRLNLLLLMAISFLPFPTRLMAEAIHSADAERAAVITYGLNVLLIAVLFGAMWELAARNPELLEPAVTPAEVAAYRRVTRPNVGFYLVLIAVAARFPKGAAFAFLVIAIVSVLRVRGDLNVGADATANREAES
jgi:uncharacterized membrane protein